MNPKEMATVSNITDYSQGVLEQSHSRATTAVLVIMALVIFLENAIVCFLFATDKKLRTTTNIFVVSLAISDLLVGVLFVPVYLATSVGHQVNLYVVTFLLFSSLFNLCGVTYDRYHAILQPLTYIAVFTCRRITIVLVCVWFLPLLLIALPFTWSYRNIEFIIEISRVYLGFMVSILFFSCVVISKVYYSIFKVIKRQMKMTQHMRAMFCQFDSHSTTSIESKPTTLNEKIQQNNCESSPLRAGSPNISPRPGHETKGRVELCASNEVPNGKNLAKQLKKQRFKKYSEKVFSDIRAAKLFAFIMIIFTICWLPVVIINFMVAIDRVALVPQFIFDVSIYAFVANALVNPLIYTFYKSDYRLALINLTGFKRKRKPFDASVEMLESACVN